ncbi:zinc finger CCCH domain-containing protein 14-like isoform X4 [Dinothrombium tinctorium]|uniref:Zinc finger CCCH domain-containing protein 14 n=1 Tax=Dinothrombium tinctorium TaxID=1965070 RepID=A0A443R5E0_9ACAR|nr:zinc finger CCCH domain-containing protein 14-like isoform X4 [Dinothrombium tinctorium]RWS11243.1 zinc finger CCCH domain-containing protein 14-like isoform X4 [Dinothrombium tinctorium]RWS11266.1 zinc finger CCCH domain-containing protein 14-like isoform X4 [Dinothrombium tinctorium]
MSVYNELPDYIMVMVANQKSRYQMKDDLSLFLGKNTDEFVDWLHESLKTMQAKVSLNESNASGGEKKKTKSTKALNAVENVSKTEKSAKARKSSESSKNIEAKTVEKETSEAKVGKNFEKSVESSLENKTVNENIQQKSTLETATNGCLKDVILEGNERNSGDQNEEQEVVLHLNEEGGETDELLQEAPENANVSQAKQISLKKNSASPALATVKPLKRENDHKMPSSTIGAVLTKDTPDEDEEMTAISNQKSVASVIKVKERKSSVPVEMQANKLLIMRAVEEAHKSVTNKPLLKRKASEDEEYSPTPIIKRARDYSLDPNDLRHYLKSNRMQEVQMNFPEKKDIINVKAEVTMEDIENQQQTNSPKFIVTLDGVPNNFASDNRIVNVDEDNVMDSELMLDAEIDEEFVEDDSIVANKDEKSDQTALSTNKLKERCKYWPSCKNGDKCLYHHPNSPCKLFPNCRFGDKCSFIHPNCKYDALCAKPDCPFTHTMKKIIPPAMKPQIASNMISTPCKYFPNCINPACPFLHPKPCVFGAKCRNPTCQFAHPLPFYSPSLPKPYQFKWKAKDQTKYF